MDQQRLNKYKALYRGPVKPSSQSTLKVRAMNDRVARRYMLTPPDVYHIANFQSTRPRTEFIPLARHQMPIHHIPEARGQTRYVRGSSKYNQALVQQIAELSKLVR